MYVCGGNRGISECYIRRAGSSSDRWHRQSPSGSQAQQHFLFLRFKVYIVYFIKGFVFVFDVFFFAY